MKRLEFNGREPLRQPQYRSPAGDLYGPSHRYGIQLFAEMEGEIRLISSTTSKTKIEAEGEARAWVEQPGRYGEVIARQSCLVTSRHWNDGQGAKEHHYQPGRFNRTPIVKPLTIGAEAAGNAQRAA